MEVSRTAHAFPSPFSELQLLFLGCHGLADGPSLACATELLLIVSSCDWSPCLRLAQGRPCDRNFRGTADI